MYTNLVVSLKVPNGAQLQHLVLKQIEKKGVVVFVWCLLH